MPQSVNGIGTTYYGKRNLETESGVCEFCHNQTTLSTYETTYFFIVVFIPIIPLGKKQIIDDCKICRRHRALPVAEWQKIRTQAIEASSTQLAEKMTDPKAAIEHLQTLTAFKQMDEAAELCEAIEATHDKDFDVQFFLGAWHEKYGQASVADRCFDKAFAIAPDNPVAIRAKGMGLAEQGKLDEAKSLLSALMPPSKHFDPGVFYKLGNEFQKQERHADALEMYKLVNENAPAIGKDKAFRKAVKRSEKAIGPTSAASILPKKSIFESKPFWWTAAAIAAVAAFLGSSIWIGGNRTVHVVNGNTVPITVKIDDGESISIRPSGFKKVPLAEGQHQVQLVSPDVGAESETFEISSSFWTRLFQKPAFVLDPTKTAAVTWEESVYSDNPHDDGDFKLEVGNLMTQYSNIDYVFEKFPAQLEVKDTTRSVTKTRVSFETLPPSYLITLADLDSETRMRIAESHVTFDPTIQNWSIYRMVAQSSGKLDQALELMESHLDDEPIDVDLHRVYQETFKTTDRPESELVAKYQQYLKASPEDANMLYLNGRLSGSVSGSTKLFKEAIAKDPDNVFTLNGLGYNQMATAEFDAAQKTFARLVKLAPDNEIYKEEYLESLFAAQKYKELKPLIDALPDSYRKFRDLATISKLTKREGEYKKIKEEYRRTPEGATDTGLLELHWNYISNDLTAYQKQVDKLDSPIQKQLFQFQVNLEQDKIDGAVEKLQNMPETYLDQALPLIAVCKNRQGDKSEAIKIWHDMLDELDQRGETSFVSLARKAEKEKVSVNEFREISLAASQKRTWGLALLEFSKFADDESWKSELSKMNFNRSFPHNFIQRMLK